MAILFYVFILLSIIIADGHRIMRKWPTGYTYLKERKKMPFSECVKHGILLCPKGENVLHILASNCLISPALISIQEIRLVPAFYAEMFADKFWIFLTIIKKRREQNRLWMDDIENIMRKFESELMNACFAYYACYYTTDIVVSQRRMFDVTKKARRRKKNTRTQQHKAKDVANFSNSE